MKKLLLALCLTIIGFVGYVGRVLAYDYVTTESTGIFISSDTNLELLNVAVSTGDKTTYILVIDSNPTSAVSEQANLRRDGGRNVYPASQYFLPPITTSSDTVSNLFVGSEIQTYDLTTKTGEGRNVKNGIVIIQSGFGATVTIGLRRIR